MPCIRDPAYIKDMACTGDPALLKHLTSTTSLYWRPGIY